MFFCILLSGIVAQSRPNRRNNVFLLSTSRRKDRAFNVEYLDGIDRQGKVLVNFGVVLNLAPSLH